MMIPSMPFRRVVVFCSWIVVCLFADVGNDAIRAADRPHKYVIGYMGVAQNTPGTRHVLGFINPDGTGETYPQFDAPNQVSWVFGPQFTDSNRFILTSFEESNTTKVRSGESKTHNWTFDRITGQLTEILQKDRPADQVRAYELIDNDKRVIVSGIINREERLFVMDLDGGNQTILTEGGAGFHYALALAEDKRRVALHVTGGKPSFYNPGAYNINVIDLATKQRTLVAGQQGHLYFGPRWSPDQKQLAYLDCLHLQDKDHFQAGICVGQVDGSGSRLVTPPQTHWFDTTFGSNMIDWSPDGKTITYTRLREGSDHGLKQGGAQICLVNPTTQEVIVLTSSEADRWDYRPAWSPDGTKLTFTRLVKGGTRELWIMDANGSNQRRLTKGYQDRAADFGKWIPAY